MEVRELVARLGAGATPEQARELLDHGDTGEAHLLAVLRKRDLASSFLEAIARHERWNGRHVIKVAIVNHPKTPKTLALRLLNQLFWKELLKVANNFRLPMPVRATAEKYIRDRLSELELGERITLARTATAGLIPGLVGERNALVIAALLNNPRLREVQVLALVEDPASPSEVLRVVGESERWASRPAVRLAVVRNSRTPVHTALKALLSLPRPTIKKLLASEGIPPVIRLRAERILSLSPGRLGDASEEIH
ncbi:MAG: hypothetical protein ACRD1X_19135 [Vicinamibacteria bacterium]